MSLVGSMLHFHDGFVSSVGIFAATLLANTVSEE